MRIILFFILSILINSCTSSSNNTKTHTLSPCQDIVYQKLKQMKISEMTDSELEYFNGKEKECREFNDDHKEASSEKKQATSNLIWILSGIGFLIGIGLWLSIPLKNWH